MASAVLFSESPIVLQALRACLKDIPDLTLMRESCTVGALISTVRDLQPQIVILDFESAHSASVAELHHIAPRAVLVLWTRELDVEMSYRALNVGVRGVLPKSIDAKEFNVAVARVVAGELYLDARTSAQLLTSKPIQLTKRETQLVRLLTQGLKNKEIASELNITEGSVKIYLSRLYAKIGAKDRYELALYGLRHIAFSRREGNSSCSKIENATTTPPMFHAANGSTQGGRGLPL